MAHHSIDVVTLFPGMLTGYFGESMLKRAVTRELVRFRVINPRDFTDDPHRTVDDRPYGGGAGMVMKPEPLVRAIESVLTPESRVVLMAPQGRVLTQAIAGELAGCRHLVFVCGHYEGIDERVKVALVHDTVSIGDFVLTNGALAAAVVIDAMVRLIPGVLGAESSAEEESFTGDGYLEYPHYTRPEFFRGMRVPEVLLSGNHAAIAHWRREQSESITRTMRPDLLRGGRDDSGR